MTTIKWRDFEVHHLIAIRGEMDEEFAKTPNKQGDFLKLQLHIFIKIECWRMLVVCGLWKAFSLATKPLAPLSPKHGRLLPQGFKVPYYSWLFLRVRGFAPWSPPSKENFPKSLATRLHYFL